MLVGDVLERGLPLGTLAGTALGETGDEQKINDGNVIVPIENPRLNGHLGFLLARHVVIGPRKTDLTQVHHVRVNYDEDEPSALADYSRVSLDRSGSFGLYFPIADRRKRLPAASRQPYKTCTITPNQYVQFLLGLRDGGMVLWKEFTD